MTRCLTFPTITHLTFLYNHTAWCLDGRDKRNVLLGNTVWAEEVLTGCLIGRTRGDTNQTAKMSCAEWHKITCDWPKGCYICICRSVWYGLLCLFSQVWETTCTLRPVLRRKARKPGCSVPVWIPTPDLSAWCSPISWRIREPWGSCCRTNTKRKPCSGPSAETRSPSGKKDGPSYLDLPMSFR